MAKKCMLYREKKRERLLKKYKAKRNTLKTELLIVDSFHAKIKIYQKIEKLPKNSTPSRQRNRCWVTGRSRGFYKDFGLSRHVLREMAQDGLMPGLTKASW